MKKFTVIVLLVALCIGPSPAYSFGDDNQNINSATGGAGGNASITGSGISTIVGSGNSRIESGAVSNRNSNMIESGAVRNYNANLQSQKQGQSQNNNQNISPTQQTSVTYEAQRQNLPEIVPVIAGPVTEYRGEQRIGPEIMAKPWMYKQEWNKELTGALPSCGTFVCNVKAESVVFYNLKKAGYSPEIVTVIDNEDGWFTIGYITVGPNKSSFANTPTNSEAWGVVISKAFEIGASAVRIVDSGYTFANGSNGWSLAIGGGASAVNNGNENYGGSVGGGIGWSGVEAFPVTNLKIHAKFYVKEGVRLPSGEK